MTDVERRFAALFAGNPDCYGSDAGGYVVGDPPWAYHLDGTTPIGIYPIWDDAVHWGCVDIDVPDFEHPTNLQNTLVALGIKGVTEKSRSKGHHIWVFLRQGVWVPAWVMRRALLVACDIADVPPKEVNPKQEHVEGVGNYVRLPYPMYGAHGTQVFVNHAGRPLTFAQALYEAEADVNDPYVIEAAAELWVPPVKSTRQLAMNIDGHDVIERGLPHHLASRLSKLPLTRTLMERGPGEDGDRSSAMVHLAHLCQENWFDPDEILAVLIEADLVWGKYIRRDHSDRELRRIVERVFA